MHYIVLDLEWNSAYCPWQQRFINEIIEFGAVKLDENLNEVSRFQCFVRSKLTKKLRSRVKGLTNITNEEMRSGVSIDRAVHDYTDWAGDDTVTMSWSDTDIHVLVDNLKTMMNLDTIPFLYKYADMQKYVQSRMGITGNQISLTAAAEQLGVNFEEFAAHRALGDCLCSAELLRRTWVDGELDKYISDTRADDYYERLLFKPYIINDINDPLIDKSQLRFRCPNCGNFMRRRSKWKFKNRSFLANFECRKCNVTLVGKLRFRKLFDSVAVTRSLTPPAPPKDESDHSDTVKPQRPQKVKSATVNRKKREPDKT